MIGDTEQILSDVQDDLAARVAADSYFVTDIPVFTEKKKDIVREVEIRLGTMSNTGVKHGICVIMQQPTANFAKIDAPVLQLEAKLVFRVLENVTINSDTTEGTLKPALAVATRIAMIVRLYNPIGLCTIIKAEDPLIVPVNDDSGALAYEVRFTALVGQQAQLAKVATPVIYSAPGTSAVSITCATPGAAIYYTTDRTYPASGNTAATLYTGPIDLQSLQTTADTVTVRAVGTLANAIDSDCNRYIAKTPVKLTDMLGNPITDMLGNTITLPIP